ncbi:hypothetical protein WJX74_003750, partial [Apatococcus lobatus]
MPNPNMSSDTMPNFVTELTDRKGNRLEVEMRADGYFDATKMCKSGGRRLDKYVDFSKTRDFLEELGSSLQLPIHNGEGAMIKSARGSAGGTWVHRKVAINLATWISPRFEVLVTDIVDRYLTGQITTEESRAVAAEVERVFPRTVPPELA